MKLSPIHPLIMLMSAGCVALAACAPMATPGSNLPPTDSEGLADTMWNLVGYGQPEALTAPLPDAPATLDITAERMGGTTGCNSFSFNYTLEGQTVKFAEPGPMMTMMACAEAVMQQETDFINVMSAVTSYALEGERLTFTGADGVVVFEVAKPLPLADTLWQLTSIAVGDAVTSVATDAQITLQFKDGQASGFAGCNNYFGGYELNGDKLTLGELGATKKFCEGEAGQREMEFLAALARVASYQIKREQLLLLDATGQAVLLFTAAQPSTATPDVLSAEALKNAEYHLPQHETPIKLVDGQYTASSGAASLTVNLLEPIAFGDLNGDGVEDAAVLLAENTGGTGTFVSLVVMLNQAGQLSQTEAVFIADRPQVKALSIQNQQVLLEANVTGPNDAACCPTFLVNQTYQLVQGQLRLTGLASQFAEAPTLRTISLESPTAGAVVAGSVQVKGQVTVAPFENTLVYRISDDKAGVLAEGPIQVVSAELGGPGTFDTTIDVSTLPAGKTVYLAVFDLSAADGSPLALVSVELHTK